MSAIFDHLDGSDVLLAPADGEEPADAARRRVLGRLGAYVEAVVRPLNMRPRAAALAFQDAERVEVRVSAAGAAVLVVIAPDGDLSSEVFFLRAVAGKHLPVRQVLAHDLSRGALPFSYAIESHTGGFPLDQLADPALLRLAARQVGRTLRRIHQTAAPGFGRPTPAGRWPVSGWREALGAWLDRRGGLPRAPDVLGEGPAAALRGATLDHPALDCPAPRVIHGAVSPDSAIVTVAESVQLEALTRPGELVGGDPMLDLALAALPCHPEPFRQGVVEGYTARGGLASDEAERLARLRLLLRAEAALRSGDEDELEQVLDAIAADREPAATPSFQSG